MVPMTSAFNFKVVKTPKFQGGIVTSRDYRELRKNPESFLNELRNIGVEKYWMGKFERYGGCRFYGAILEY